jgi:hypothetical protein
VPGPKKFFVEDLMEKEYIPFFASMARRIVESMNLIVVDDHYEYTKINGLPVVDFQYQIKSILGPEGYFRLFGVLTSKVYYIFFGLTLEEEALEGKKTINEIISSIRINTEMIPDDIGPKTYGEIVQQTKLTLESALVGMPPGWGWQAKHVEVRITGDRKQILAELFLQRPDTQILIEDFKKAIAELMEGREPDMNKLASEPENIFGFFNQIFMIAGLVASGSVVYDKLPVDDIVLDIVNDQGQTNLSLILNAQKLADLVNMQDPSKLLEIIKIQ